MKTFVLLLFVSLCSYVGGVLTPKYNRFPQLASSNQDVWSLNNKAGRTRIEMGLTKEKKDKDGIHREVLESSADDLSGDDDQDIITGE